MINLLPDLKTALSLEHLINFANEKTHRDSHIHLWSKDRKGKYLSVNEYMYNDAGLSKEADMIGLTDLDLCWEKQGILFRSNDEKVMRNRKIEIFIEPSKVISGKEIIFYSYKTPLYVNSKKVLGTMGIAFTLNPPEKINKSCDSNKIYSNRLLSLREKQCLHYFLNGKTAKETAILLGLSHRTIEEYFNNIKKKLGCQYKRDLLGYFK